MRLLSSPPTPRDRFTKDTMKKPSHVEHVVIVGYYQEFLPMLISEMKEESSDYLQDTICMRNILMMRDSRNSNSRESESS